MSDRPQLVLLDTHIWIWMVTNIPKALSPRLKALLEKLAVDSAIRISAISVLEVGNLVLKNRMGFEIGVREWVNGALQAQGVRVEMVTPEIALESTLLPEGFHGDPADRILMATANQIGATLITRDKEILAYSKKYGFSALSL